MTAITENSTQLEVAAIVSQALQDADIAATLSGGSVVSIYSDNAYQSKDLDFVTAALVYELDPVLEKLGFRHQGDPGGSLYEHPHTEWFWIFAKHP